MKPHPGIRKTIKWGGAAATVLLVVVWVGSGWGAAGYHTDTGGAIFVAAGAFFVRIASAGHGMSGWWMQSNEKHGYWLHWWFDAYQTKNVQLLLQIPLWALTSVTAGITALAWRLDVLARRRARLNLCPKCNYDRAGIGAAMKCPECGHQPGV